MSQPDGDGGLFKADTQLFESGNFADATIVCGSRTWKVHKLILGSRCKWFRAAFYGNMTEATSGQVVLQDQDPDLVDIMLRYIYDRGKETDKLHAKLQFEGGKDLPVLCVRLFRLADFFLLNELGELAREGLRIRLNKTIQDHDNKVSDLSQNLTEVSEAIRDAYKDNSTEQLREMLLSFLWMRDNRYFQIPQTIDLLNEVPELGKDLMKVYLSVDPTTDRRDRPELPRSLLVLDAVRLPYASSRANGYLSLKSWTNDTRERCLLRPERYANVPFKPMTATFNSAVWDLRWVAPYAHVIAEMGTHEESSIVSVTHCINDPPHLYIRFPTPADARHYIQSYRNARPEIKETNRSPYQLEDDMSMAENEAENYERDCV